MKIAQVAPLYESCPPQYYGGTERVVSYLTEELVRQGHEVTLFASGDSRTAARLDAACRKALRLDERVQDPIAHHIVQLNHVAKQSLNFDIIHFHADYLHFPVSARLPCASVTTLHGRLDLPDLVSVFAEFSDAPLVSISNNQRLPIPAANWRATVYHGLPRGLYPLGAGDGGYLAFIGRISPEKCPDRAIEIARRVGMTLRIAAKVDKADKRYFETTVRPLLGGADVEFIGEIGEQEKVSFLGGATAMLFPVDWPEPFGLAMIESMANGTPVIAFRRGSVPEVVDDGITGFIVDSIDEAAEAVRKAARLDRAAVRRCFEKRFSAERMTRDYLAVYGGLLSSNTPHEPTAEGEACSAA